MIDNLSIEELFKKEFYVVDCYDFVYFPRIVHIIGVEGSSSETELGYYVDMSDEINENTTMYKWQLTRFKTFEDCKKYAEYLNEIPENKKRAEQWNKIDKFLLRAMRGNSND